MAENKVQSVQLFEDSTQKNKERIARWESYLEAVDAELEANGNACDSKAADQLTLLVTHILGMQFQEAKSITFEWLKNKGLKELEKSGKPGWKQGSALALSTVASVAGAIFSGVPAIGGFTGAAKGGLEIAGGVATGLGSGGNHVTGMMQSVEGTKHTTCQFKHEMSKRSGEDQNDQRRKLEELLNRYYQAIKEKEQAKFDTALRVTG